MPLLIDTDVLIDYLRDQADAVDYLRAATEQFLISAVTVAELYSGVREGTERIQLDAFINDFEIVPVDKEIASMGGLYRREYFRSHGTELPDAIIAATADIREANLVTLNKKHFPMLSNVIVPYHKP